ncbi:MAG: hypothetical protein Q9224_002869 [Gallowayella concinna]
MPRSRPVNESSGGKSKDRKSKRPTSSSPSSPSHSPQQKHLNSLGDLHPTKHSSIISEESPSKRIKLTHPPAQESPQSVNLNQMYDFSRPNHIDLTNSNGPATMTAVQKKPLGMAKPPATSTDSGPKRLVIKNLRKTPRSDPEKYINQVWSQLHAALSAILADSRVPYSNEELYRGAENLCRQGQAPQLFTTICQKCKQGISSQFEEPLVARASTMDDIGILTAVLEAWDIWKTRLKTIISIFFFLDRSYLLHSPLLPSIEEMGTKEFRDIVFSHQALKPRIIGGACDLLVADRQKEKTTQGDDLLRKAVKMFHTLSVYTSSFEPEFLARSSSYIASWSDQKAESLDLAQYIKESWELINLELGRSLAMGLDSTTQKTLENYLFDLLVDQEDRQKKLLHTAEVSRLLHEDNRDALKGLFMLVDKQGLVSNLRLPFEAYIGDDGSQIVFDETREQEMVPRLLEFKKKLDSIWEDSFFKDEGLGHSLREAFENFINKSKRSNMTWGTDNPKPGEMIAKHVDRILKGGMRGTSSHAAVAKGDNNEDVDISSEDEDVEINRQLDQVLELFRFVHGKAVFEAFYKRDLARRLLLNRSASADAEKSMLTRLTSECGAGFTHNLEQMFKDMELSREEVASYKLILDKREVRPNLDLDVSVLSASAWPTYPDIPLIIPRDVQKAATIFEDHYKVKHTNRKIVWKHSLAHCQLKAIFPKGNKELVVSSYQAVVLLLFSNQSNNNDIAYPQIQAATGLDDISLKRTLQSLACANYRVLSKTPKGKDVNISDTFTINVNFTNPKYRIKINQVQAKETKEENKETHERVAADRNYETQAAIVRIMKGKKTITHVNLVTEVIDATKSRGVLDMADIKKNIEK